MQANKTTESIKSPQKAPFKQCMTNKTIPEAVNRIASGLIRQKKTQAATETIKKFLGFKATRRKIARFTRIKIA
jgi:hypothetical protein